MTISLQSRGLHVLFFSVFRQISVNFVPSQKNGLLKVIYAQNVHKRAYRTQLECSVCKYGATVEAS
jgi:hypothetical protein